MIKYQRKESATLDNYMKSIKEMPQEAYSCMNELSLEGWLGAWWVKKVLGYISG